MLPLHLLLVLGCSTQSPETLPSPGWKSSKTAQTGGSYPDWSWERGRSDTVVKLMDDLEHVHVDLADNNFPDGAEAIQTYRVPLRYRSDERQRFRIQLPFDVPTGQQRDLARSLRVEVGGRELRHVSLANPWGAWRLDGQRLMISPSLKGDEAVLTYSGGKTLFDRRSVERSGLTPKEFIRRKHTHRGVTRSGVQLTSPSRLTWTVDVPVGGRFTSHVGLAHPVLRDQASDGMRVEAHVRTSNGRTEVGRHLVRSLALKPWSVDLSAWAGKRVELELSSVPTGEPAFDEVFIGAPTLHGTPTKAVRRILVIGLDTTRPASMGWFGYSRDTTPELDAFANQSAVMVNAWTPAPRTRPSFRSAFTGRYPLDAVGATNISEAFSRHGFATAGFAANIHLQPRFGFDNGFDLWTYAPRSNAEGQVRAAMDWFDDHVDRDTFVFMHIMDPHMNYQAPSPYGEQFLADPDPAVPTALSRHFVQEGLRSGTLTNSMKSTVIGRYDGEMRYTSAQIGRLVKHLDGLPGKTLIVIHSDHGEELFEHGGFEHNHTLYDEVTRGVLMVRPPGGTKDGAVVVDQPATLADIGPTLYRLVDLQQQPPTDGIDLTPYMKGADTTGRDIGIAHLRFGHDRWGVVHDQHKYIVWTASGREQLFDLRRDPAEQKDLASTTDLAPFRTALRGAHPGLNVFEGWRVKMMKAEPFGLTLPANADAAILDPSLEQKIRANLAWGERSQVNPGLVGSIERQDDELEVLPGRLDGQIWVGPTSAPPTETLKLDGRAIPGKATASGTVFHLPSGGQVDVVSSLIVLPPPGEAERMERPEADASQEETCTLCRLGYIEGSACLPCE